MKNKIFVTRPSLPPLEDFRPYLERIWENKILTNNGELHGQLEAALCEYLGVRHASLFCNGTIALLTSLKALGITGEVITTPFSFVATAHALTWNGITPVFADIDPVTFNLDPGAIEDAVTERTEAIMPVHVYGTPCDIDAIGKIADSRGLKVIYDAAHAFGVKKDGVSILNHGDLSVLSFHATKTFTTLEGGAIICHDAEMKDRIDKLKNFGFAGETKVIECGINGKMNEVQAAFGLLNLKHVDDYIARRKAIALRYREELNNRAGITVMNEIDGVTANYSYFPILIDEETFGESRDSVYERLKQNNIYCRRYFYPLITDFPMYKDKNSRYNTSLTNAKRISSQVLCLPIFPDLEISEIKIILEIVTA